MKEMTKKEFKESMNLNLEAHNTSEKIRGAILSKAILLEQVISLFICNYFVSLGKRDLFNELVLEKEFFTFENKIKVLEKLEIGGLMKRVRDMKGNPFRFSEDKKEFIKAIRWVREIRNAIAHKRAGLEVNEKALKIRYHFDVKDKEILLNDQFLKRFWDITSPLSNILLNMSLKLDKQ